MRSHKLLGVLVGLGALATSAMAQPAVNGAVIHTRVFNDDSNSTVVTTNLYPTMISITDRGLDGDGAGGEFANRHNFRLSEDGGASDAVFMNNHPFAFFSDVRLSGTAVSEGGLNLSPWWSQQVDGVFMVNGGSGEVAIFGGRLPFYSFTGNHGVTYAPGSTVRLGLAYDPNGLSQSSPGTIRYFYTDASGTYASPTLAFDQGNPAEDPPYGLWGILNDARLGGYFQPQIQVGNPNNFGMVEFSNMVFVPEPASLTLIGLAGLALVRRRR